MLVRVTLAHVYIRGISIFQWANFPSQDGPKTQNFLLCRFTLTHINFVRRHPGVKTKLPSLVIPWLTEAVGKQKSWMQMSSNGLLAVIIALSTTICCWATPDNSEFHPYSSLLFLRQQVSSMTISGWDDIVFTGYLKRISRKRRQTDRFPQNQLNFGGFPVRNQYEQRKAEGNFQPVGNNFGRQPVQPINNFQFNRGSNGNGNNNNNNYNNNNFRSYGNNVVYNFLKIASTANFFSSARATTTAICHQFRVPSAWSKRSLSASDSKWLIPSIRQ